MPYVALAGGKGAGGIFMLARNLTLTLPWHLTIDK
jgi:hypothetical protein